MIHHRGDYKFTSRGTNNSGYEAVLTLPPSPSDDEGSMQIWVRSNGEVGIITGLSRDVTHRAMLFDPLQIIAKRCGDPRLALAERRAAFA
jgi:hypothetical protein